MDNLFSVLSCNWGGLHEGLGGWAGPVFFLFLPLVFGKAAFIGASENPGLSFLNSTAL